MTSNMVEMLLAFAGLTGIAEGGHHYHRCVVCGFVWCHSDEMAGNEEAHTCPCGEQQWGKVIKGRDDAYADYVGNGKPVRMRLEESCREAVMGIYNNTAKGLR